MVLVTRILSIKKPWQSKFDSIIFKAKKENQRKFKANRWLLERLWLAKSVTLSIRVSCWGVILKISLSILKIDGEWIGRYFICLSRQNHNLKVIDLLKTDILISELQVWKFHVSKWLSMIFGATLPLKLEPLSSDVWKFFAGTSENYWIKSYWLPRTIALARKNVQYCVTC